MDRVLLYCISQEHYFSGHIFVFILVLFAMRIYTFDKAQ